MIEKKDIPLIIKEALGPRVPATIEDGEAGYRHGAVLIPLLRDNGEYRVLFTKRTHRVEEHKGQISFPGGAVEDGDDSFEETALRETFEEVGVLPEDVTLLGRTDDARTLASNFVVHPVVGLIPYPYAFRINPVEVDRLILAPLDIFLPGSPLAGEREVEYGGRAYRTFTYHYDGEVIWGATAKIMKDLAEIIGQKLGLLPGVQ
jgi:8-oxo-dGTP pyrophosphatase MutT (NUDIX family)